MASPNRSQLITKLYKVLRKHYHATPTPERNLLEHLLYGCLLENSPAEAADAANAKLLESFFDFNEVRVTTAAELAESLSALPQPLAAAANFKRVLQSVFEAVYNFDLEPLKKQNLGKAVEQMKKYVDSPFAVAYANQHGLGGHEIPLDAGALEALFVAGVILEADLAKGEVPGLERAIPKNKGMDFASLLHQLGVDFRAGPQSQRMKSLLAELEPGWKERLTRLLARRAEVERASNPKAAAMAARAAREAKAEKAAKAARDAKSGAASAKAEAAAAKSRPAESKPADPKAAAAKKSPPAAPAPASKKPEKEAKGGKEKPASRKAAASGANPPNALTRKKPR